MANVLVVGAGPTGLTAALVLARLGQRVQIVERRAAPSPLSRAVAVQKRSIEIFAPTGVSDTILSEAIVFDAVVFHLGSQRVGRLPLNSDDGAKQRIAILRCKAQPGVAIPALGSSNWVVPCRLWDA